MRKIFFTGFAIVAGFLLLAGPKRTPQLDWPAAKNLPFKANSGIQLARQDDGGRPAVLFILCSTEGQIHFLLLTRLPSHRYIRTGPDDDVSVYADRAELKLPVVADVVDKGAEVDWLDELISGDDDAPVDTIVTPQLGAGFLDDLKRQFGSSPPSSVVVVGIQETSVAMRGVAMGTAIEGFRTACKPLR